MTTASDLRPRPLWNDEMPTRGDLHFAVGFGPKSAFVSQVIAVGTASRTNHVGIIVEATPSHWKIVEALSKGVVGDVHQPPPVSTVIRVSDDPAIREELAVRAEAGAAAVPHIEYDWATIFRIVFVGLVGRVPFLAFAVIASPLIALWVHPGWLWLLITIAAVVLLYLVRPWLFQLAMACPWPNPPNHMICSEFARRVIEAVFGADSLPGLADVTPTMTAPGDLLQELLHRCDYWTPVPTRQAVTSRRIRH